MEVISKKAPTGIEDKIKRASNNNICGNDFLC